MVTGSHRRASYFEGEPAGPAGRRGWLLRLWQLVRPPLPAPLTATLNSPAGSGRRTSLAHLEADDVRGVRFGSARFREGYDQGEVDDFLDRVESHLRSRDSRLAGPLTAQDVINQTFGATKFRVGYDQDEVDDFLDRIVTELRRQR